MRLAYAGISFGEQVTHMATAVPTFSTLPRLGNGAAGAGRLEAVRVFSLAYLAREDEHESSAQDRQDDFDETCASVHQGAAPEEFKDAFFTTLHGLITAVR